MLYGIKYLIVSFFSHLGFWSGNLFLIVPFPDLCLLVPSILRVKGIVTHKRKTLDVDVRLIAIIVFICFIYCFTSKSTATVMSGH